MLPMMWNNAHLGEERWWRMGANCSVRGEGIVACGRKNGGTGEQFGHPEVGRSILILQGKAALESLKKQALPGRVLN